MSDTQECGMEPCPIDGGWSSWDDFHICTTTCGGGTQYRTKYCNNPVPLYGGAPCFEDDGNEGTSSWMRESQNCNMEPCPDWWWANFGPGARRERRV